LIGTVLHRIRTEKGRTSVWRYEKTVTTQEARESPWGIDQKSGGSTDSMRYRRKSIHPGKRGVGWKEKGFGGSVLLIFVKRTLTKKFGGKDHILGGYKNGDGKVFWTVEQNRGLAQHER